MRKDIGLRRDVKDFEKEVVLEGISDVIAIDRSIWNKSCCIVLTHAGDDIFL